MSAYYLKNCPKMDKDLSTYAGLVLKGVSKHWIGYVAKGRVRWSISERGLPEIVLTEKWIMLRGAT